MNSALHPKKLLCFAHRGGGGKAPENTMAAFARAVRMGTDWIELDIRAVEGELIVFHDERLERTTDGIGPVSGQKLSYLRSLDAGDGQKIPFLSEVLDLAAGRVGINIELKDQESLDLLSALLPEYVGRTCWSELLLSSFDRSILARIPRCMPQVRIGVLTEHPGPEDVDFARSLNAFSLHPGLDSLHLPFVEACHAKGLLVIPYTVNTRKDMVRVQNMGADGIFTDYPELVLERRVNPAAL